MKNFEEVYNTPSNDSRVPKTTNNQQLFESTAPYTSYNNY